MNYKTYAEAKIANPDSDIVTTGNNWSGGKDLLGTFEAVITGSIGRHIIDDKSWVICNPADYCSSVKEFLDAGFKFAVGDSFLSAGGAMNYIEEIYPKTNDCEKNDNKRYILSASALSGGCKIPANPERELFIDKSMEVFKENQHNKAEFMLGKIFDAGARYKDLTQHFGENI